MASSPTDAPIPTEADPTTADADAVLPAQPASTVFSVHLDVFEGPFDLLLGLIAKHQLDLTSLALSQVTDEFLAHIRALGKTWDLGQATDFLVVAATLLDLKAARLLPSVREEDEEDLALLEARDLLFARLLQYRAYKQVAALLAEMMAAQALRHPRSASLEPRFAGLLPEVLLGLGPQQFAELAARAMAPRPVPEVAVDHVHGGTVSVREQTALLRERLRRTGGGSFRALTADCQGTLEVVARFLGLLELYREGVLSFEQVEALGDLHVRWTGSDDDVATDAGAQFDDDLAGDGEGAGGADPDNGQGAGAPVPSQSPGQEAP